MSEYKLHCFCQSGNAYKCARMLNCAGADWEPVFVDFMNGATRDAAWRASVNEMGEAPMLEHAGERLSQSGVILHYLADQLGKYGRESESERREIWRWILWDNHKFTSFFASYRFRRSFAPSAEPAVMDFLKDRIDAAFAIADKRLAQPPFVVADRPTIADFSMIGYLFYPTEETGYDLTTTHPNIAAWVARMRALDGWQDPYDLMPGQRIAPRSS